MVTVFGAGMCACISLGRGALGGVGGWLVTQLPLHLLGFVLEALRLFRSNPLIPLIMLAGGGNR